MRSSIKAKDFLAPVLVWVLALTGCVIGDVEPAAPRMAALCVTDVQTR